MKYCKKCGRAIKRGMSFCPYCLGDNMKAKSVKQNGEIPSQAGINSLSKKPKSKKLIVTAIILSSILILGALFVVLDYTGIIPTGFFGGQKYFERYVDDDGDARAPDTDEKIITETVKAENGGETD